MPGIDSNTKLMLHCDGIDESTDFPDVSDSVHTVNVTATVEVDTAVKKWGTGAALFDGDSGYFDIDNSADWDVCGSNSDDWVIDYWAKHTDYTGAEVYFTQWEDINNRWVLYHGAAQGVRFIAKSGGDTIIDLGFAQIISDSNWHHIALCKVASKYGVYVDGTQGSYADDDDIDTFTGSLMIGAENSGTPSGFFDGHMDEIRIHQYNYFGAAPADAFDNGETPDTITVPPSSYARDLAIDVHDCTDLKEKVGG